MKSLLSIYFAIFIDLPPTTFYEKESSNPKEKSSPQIKMAEIQPSAKSQYWEPTPLEKNCSIFHFT